MCSIHYKSYHPLNAGTEAFCSVAKQITSYNLFLLNSELQILLPPLCQKGIVGFHLYLIASFISGHGI